MSLLNYSPLYPKVNFLTYLILQKKKNIYIYIHRERERERENNTWARRYGISRRVFNSISKFGREVLEARRSYFFFFFCDGHVVMR